MPHWTSAVCRTNGIDIHYLRSGGARPAVVLLHGLMGSGACWTRVARALEGAFDVVMPDARGHGGSSAPARGYRYEDLAGDVIALIDALALAQPVLVGHSMGGMTAAVAASRGSGSGRMRALVLVDPTFLGLERQREVHESGVAAQHRRALGLTRAELIAEARARHPERPIEILEYQAEARLNTRMAALDVLTPPNPAYREVMRAVDVPCLLVTGVRDPVVTPAMALELRELNPCVRIAQVPDAGHGLPFQQPARLAAIVASFLRQLPPAVALRT